jgi:multimeric flavodoxin WrbA
MQDLKNIVIINGSPKVSLSSTSNCLSKVCEKSMKSDALQVLRVNVRESLTHKGWDEAFEMMLKADALVFIFPLYVFCLPGMMMRFLQDYFAFFRKKGGDAGKTKVYAVVNCGFPEADINREAVEVIRCFSKKIGADFRFGVLVGGGGMFTDVTENASFMKKTFTELENSFRLMARDIQGSLSEPLRGISVQIGIPRKLYLFMADKGWISVARKNGLKKKQLYARPYIN